MIKTITFDIGGTLLEGGLDTENYRRELIGYLIGSGCGVGEDAFKHAMRNMLARLAKTRRGNREASFEELYASFLIELGVNPTGEVLEDIKDIYCRNFRQFPIAGAEEVLEILWSRYKLAAISNTMSGAPRKSLVKHGLIKFFEVVLLSRDIGVRKPDPAIFLAALDRMGVKPSDAIHVGDSIRYDVEGAKSAGMEAIWIDLGKGEFKPNRVKPNYIVSSINEVPKTIKRLAQNDKNLV